MKKIALLERNLPLSWLPLLFLSCGPFAAPASADLTHGERARVPAPIYDAYVAALHAGHFYVCSDEKREIGRELNHDFVLIRWRYMPNFDASDAGPDDPIEPLPTHCPAPYELSDYRMHISAFRRAVRHLTHVLNAAGAAHSPKVRAPDK